jgi:hypothetical protein
MNAANYDTYDALAIGIGGYPRPHVRLDGLATFNEIYFKPGSAPATTYRSESVKDVGVNLVACFYPTPKLDPPGLYPLAGVGVGTVFWDYVTPVPSTGPGAAAMLTHDGVFYSTAFAGVGARVVRSQFVDVNLSAVWGMRVFGAHLGSESENDRFRNVAYARVLLELGHRIR